MVGLCTGVRRYPSINLWSSKIFTIPACVSPRSIVRTYTTSKCFFKVSDEKARYVQS